MHYERFFVVDLQKPRHEPGDIGAVLFTGDDTSVRVGAEITTGKTPVEVSGTVKGYVILPNGMMIPPIDGQKEGNRVWIDLNELSMSMTGRIKVSIRVVDGSNKITVLNVCGTVRRVDADMVIDPDDVTPTWAQVLDKIEQMDQAAEDCRDAAEEARETADMIAPTEESTTASAAHAAGSYFIYGGDLYRATADIAIGGTITPGTNCEVVTVGGELSDLKSASGVVKEIDMTPAISGKYVNSTGDLSTDNKYAITSQIDMDVGETLAISVGAYQTAICVIAQYDGTVYVPLVMSSASDVTEYRYIATERISVVISYKVNTEHSAYVYHNFDQITDGTKQDLVKSGLIRYVDFSDADIGHYISNTSVYSSQSNYALSDTIELNIGDTVVFAGYGTSGGVSMIASYDGTNYRSLVVASGTAVKEYKYTATDHIAVVLSYNKRSRHSAYVIHNSQVFDAYAQAKLNSKSITNEISFENAITGYYISYTGDYSTSNVYALVDNIKVYAGQSIDFYAYGYQENVAMIAEKTSPTTYTCLVKSSGELKHYTYTFDRDMTIALSYNERDDHTATIMSNPLDVIIKKTKLSNLFGYGVLFPRLAVIGDSLSSGNIAGSVDTYGSSWLSYLARYINASARTHYSEGGMACKTWLSTYLTKMQTDTPFNAYFIALGTNDLARSDYSLGNIDDIAGTNSFVGYYKEIIEAIQEHAPNAVIFCVSTFNNRPDATAHFEYSEMISDICDLYTGVFYIDYIHFGKINTITGGVWSGESHFSTMGYVYVASVIYQLVCECVENNMNFFKTFGRNNYVGEKYND